ncbi:MAG: bifunctional 5,10-methylenetetrahydrofolate dehydrogenase/5,10-methenyltetrahydrofolate cyclohydrolase [Candidatus Woesebacteria bacterium]|jgi:methylenetetrahydrofolate dehydrogenase (NADP+)/methenyltetrahydrofolate cyclohydrolase
MTHTFDGKGAALARERKLKNESSELKREGAVPKLVSILVGDDKASKLYVRLKKQAGGRVGVEVEILTFSETTSVDEIVEVIGNLNKDDSVHGIMVQLPLPDNYSLDDRERIIDSIDTKKDVDGLRDESYYTAPVVASVIHIIDEAVVYVDEDPLVVVVGASGFEGKKIVDKLRERGFRVEGADTKTRNLKKVTQDADILISVTGEPDLIKSDMVSPSAVMVDVGSPRGDVEKNLYDKVEFISPVPGGVGPLTVSYLMENVIEATKTSA